jgi:hypothetical protein
MSVKPLAPQGWEYARDIAARHGISYALANYILKKNEHIYKMHRGLRVWQEEGVDDVINEHTFSLPAKKETELKPVIVKYTLPSSEEFKAVAAQIRKEREQFWGVR